MREIRFIPDDQVATRSLSRQLYSDQRDAPVELVINGFDAARRRHVTPVVHIQIWEPGTHSIYPGGRVLTITDNGTGFTDEVIQQYVVIGRSAGIGHGRHGVGKLAPFALVPEDDPAYSIATAIEKSGRAELWEISGNIFGQGFTPKSMSRRDIPGAPLNGTFAQIIVPHAELTFTKDELVTRLTGKLPLVEWTVTVNGVQVPPRELKILAECEIPATPGIPGKGWIEFGMEEDRSENDDVFLIDAANGRPVAKLGELPNAIKRRLDPILLDPRLVGNIAVPGLEDYSDVARGSFGSRFWTSLYGKTLLEILQSLAAEEARKVVGEEKGKSNVIMDSLKRISETFTSTFGAPDIPGDDPGGTNSGSSGGGGPNRPQTRRKKRSTKGKSKGASKPRGTQGVYVRVEDFTYRLMTFPTRSPRPSEVRAGDTIVINTSHHRFVRARKGGEGPALREHLVHSVVEAHVASRYTTGEIDQVWRIRGSLDSSS